MAETDKEALRARFKRSSAAAPGTPPEFAGKPEAPVQKAPEKVQAESGPIASIKKAFQSWDADGSGTISRAELSQVLMKLTNRSLADTNVLLNEIDANGDGVIQWEEFVEWVMNPEATMKMTACGTKIVQFDFAKALLPLFHIYDRSGNDEFINIDDFRECHNIIQGALKMFPSDAGLNLPTLAERDVDDIFKEVDKDDDKAVCFDEFVAWQKKELERSGIPNFQLGNIIQKLTETLDHIFHIDEQAAAGHNMDGSQEQLLTLIESLAGHVKDIWSEKDHGLMSEEAQEGLDTPEYYNHWCEPSVGMSLDRLKRFHMADIKLRTFRLVSCDVEVRLCVPQVPREADERGRLWYAKVRRTTLYEQSPDNKPQVDVYYYQYHDLNWTRLKDSEPFYHAATTLAPELQMFCLLKTEANMGINIRWQGIMSAFEDAVEINIIKQRDVEKYRRKMIEFAQEVMADEGVHMDLDNMDECQKKAAEELLAEKLEMMPRHVMAGLSELKVMNPSPVWAEFMA